MYPPSGRARSSTGEEQRVQAKSGGGEVEPVLSAASLHSKESGALSVVVVVVVVTDDDDDAVEDEGVSKAKETVEAFPSSGGALVIAGGSLGAEAHSEREDDEAGTSLGESPLRILAAAAAPWTARAKGWDPPRGSDRPLTTIEIEPPREAAGGAPKKASGAKTRSTLLAESLTAPPLPSSVAPPPGRVTSRSRSLTRAEAAAGEGGRSVQASVTTSGEGKGGEELELGRLAAFSRQKRTTPPSETETLSANARPQELKLAAEPEE